MASPGPERRAQSNPVTSLLTSLLTSRKVLGTASAAAACYVAYRAYYSESASQLTKVRKTLNDLALALSTLTSTSALVLNDLSTFLNSDSDELPRSLRQLSKLVQSPEVQATVARTVTTVGNAISALSPSSGSASTSQLLQQVLDAVLSDRGQTLVGIAVERATRHATATFCEFLERSRQQDGAAGNAPGQDSLGPVLQTLLTLMASEQGERVLTLVLTKSIREAVTSYVDATAGINFYNDMVASIRPPEQREALTDFCTKVTAVFCKEMVTAIRAPLHRAASAAAASHATTNHHHSTTNHLAPITRSSSSTGSVISLTGHMGHTSDAATTLTTNYRRRSSADEVLHLVADGQSQLPGIGLNQLRQRLHAARPPLPPQHSVSGDSFTAQVLKPANLQALSSTVGSMTHSTLGTLVREPALFQVITAMIGVSTYHAFRGTSEVFFSWMTLTRLSAVFAMLGMSVVCVWVLWHASPASAVRWLATLSSSSSP